MGLKISKYMSYVNLFIGVLLILFSLINNLSIWFTLIGILAVLVSSASIYLKKKITIQEDNQDK
jgi:LPXTG-motif cell wall-anchored protein